VVAAAVVAWLGAPLLASAQVGPTEASCRKTISKVGAKYVKTIQKTIVGCHKRRNAGKISESVDCNDLALADDKGKLPVLAQRTRDAITGDANCGASGPQVLAQFGRCPAPLETIDDGGPTTGIDDFDQLADCVLAHADLLTESTAAEVLGLPAVPLDADAAKCHATLAKSYTKVVYTTIRELAKCQASVDKHGGNYEFDCAYRDTWFKKIRDAKTKAAAKIAAECSVLNPLKRGARAGGLPGVDSCADTVDGLIACAIDAAATRAGGGTAAMLWELPGICPGSGSYTVVPVSTDTELDLGYSGLVHDMDPILGYRGARFTVSCDADCANCSSSAVTPDPNACRCSGDVSVVCSDDLDCGGVGGTCQCFYGPPTAYNAAGSPACVTMGISGAMSGSLDPVSGDISLTVPLSVRIYLGIAQTQPCPRCEAGVCDGGQRDGLACAVDASDATFGDVSYDCPPSTAQNITGTGTKVTVDYTTGTASLPFATACDAPFGSRACACAVCSGDVLLACTSNADCAGFGTCTGGGPAPISRYPNTCSDVTCSPDPGAGPHEGTCLDGPDDIYCDGLLRSNGRGILPCGTNADCSVLDAECPGMDCGACTLSQPRECFLDPIVAEGSPGETLVGVGCFGATTNLAVNSVTGLPGAYRVRENLSAELLCSDGVTPYNPPGGSNCP